MIHLPALDRLLAAAAIDLEAFAVCEISPDTRLVIPPLDNIEVHYVLSGTLHLAVEGADRIVATPGSVIVVPPHRGQRLGGSAQTGRETSSRSVCSQRGDGLNLYDAADGKAGAVRIMCGQITADILGSFGLFSGMAAPISADLADDPLVRPAFQTMLSETDGPGPCSSALSASLMKACLVLLLRRELERHGAARLPAIFQKQWLADIVTTILAEPLGPYSVESLAALSGRSRSTFAKDFAAHVGATPMEFVTQARLNLGRELLLESDAPVAAIARQSGFPSRSHFSRMFKEIHGTDPTAFRQRHRASGGEPT